MLKKAIEVVANRAQNRLHITIYGNLNRENRNKLLTEISSGVADLSPGFAVIADLSHCSRAWLGGLPTFRKITNQLVMNKAGRVVRVIDAKKIIQRKILSFTAKMNGREADLFYSLAEAKAALSTEQRRDGLRFVLLEQSVIFRAGGREGTGLIHDLSTSGCAITTADELPAVADEIFISVGFKKHEEIMGNLECNAEVIWVKSESFGIKFTIENDLLKEQLWERLDYESKCELP